MGKRKITAADLFDTLEIDLWGNNYTFRQVTRSVLAKLEEAQEYAEKLDEADDASTDDKAMAVIAVVDALLAPSNGEVPAAELLGDLWRKDELGMDWLGAFAETLNEEAAARRRPTSAPMTSN